MKTAYRSRPFRKTRRSPDRLLLLFLAFLVRLVPRLRTRGKAVSVAARVLVLRRNLIGGLRRTAGNLVELVLLSGEKVLYPAALFLLDLQALKDRLVRRRSGN